VGAMVVFDGNVVLPQCALRVAAATASGIGLSSGGLDRNFRYHFALFQLSITCLLSLFHASHC
jgi:hypothetical protein